MFKFTFLDFAPIEIKIYKISLWAFKDILFEKIQKIQLFQTFITKTWFIQLNGSKINSKTPLV